jgi:hypothetical protein
MFTSVLDQFLTHFLIRSSSLMFAGMSACRPHLCLRRYCIAFEGSTFNCHSTRSSDGVLSKLDSLRYNHTLLFSLSLIITLSPLNLSNQLHALNQHTNFFNIGQIFCLFCHCPPSRGPYKSTVDPPTVHFTVSIKRSFPPLACFLASFINSPSHTRLPT